MWPDHRRGAAHLVGDHHTQQMCYLFAFVLVRPVPFWAIGHCKDYSSEVLVMVKPRLLGGARKGKLAEDILGKMCQVTLGLPVNRL